MKADKKLTVCNVLSDFWLKGLQRHLAAIFGGGCAAQGLWTEHQPAGELLVFQPVYVFVHYKNILLRVFWGNFIGIFKNFTFYFLFLGQKCLKTCVNCALKFHFFPLISLASEWNVKISLHRHFCCHTFYYFTNQKAQLWLLLVLWYSLLPHIFHTQTFQYGPHLYVVAVKKKIHH